MRPAPNFMHCGAPAAVSAALGCLFACARRFGQLLPAALASCLLLGCSLIGQPGPTAVAQSRYFQSGSAEYDPFFEQLYRIQRYLTECPTELDHAGDALARRLKLTPGIAPPELGDALEQEASRLATTGVYLSLVIQSYADGEKREAKHELTLSGKPASRTDERLLEEVEKAADAAAKIHAELDAITKSLPALGAQRFELQRKLASVSSDTLKVSKEELTKNLTDAEDALPPLRKQAFALLDKSAALIDALERGFDTLRKKPADAVTAGGSTPSGVDPAKPVAKPPAVKPPPPKPRKDAFQP